MAFVFLISVFFRTSTNEASPKDRADKIHELVVELETPLRRRFGLGFFGFTV